MYDFKPLDRSFFAQNTIDVARKLIGKKIVRRVEGHLLVGIITETEAYLDRQDPASHAFCGRTKRNAAMFGMIGHAYVYFVYGNHFCFNIVAREKKSLAGAVLIRSIEPFCGVEMMQRFRGYRALRQLTNGPGKLTQALGINKTHNLIDCTKSGELFIAKTDIAYDYIATPRIGISKAVDRLWRFIAQ